MKLRDVIGAQHHAGTQCVSLDAPVPKNSGPLNTWGGFCFAIGGAQLGLASLISTSWAGSRASGVGITLNAALFLILFAVGLRLQLGSDAGSQEGDRSPRSRLACRIGIMLGFPAVAFALAVLGVVLRGLN